MSVLSACVYVHHVHTWCLRRLEEDPGRPGTGVCGSPCGFWELHLGPLEEK